MSEEMKADELIGDVAYHATVLMTYLHQHTTPEQLTSARWHCQKIIDKASRTPSANREVVARRELEDLCAKVEADAVAALSYIEMRYGRLEGVGWDRVFDAHDELFAKAEASQAALSAMPATSRAA